MKPKSEWGPADHLADAILGLLAGVFIGAGMAVAILAVLGVGYAVFRLIGWVGGMFLS